MTGCFDEPYLSPDVRDFTAEQMKVDLDLMLEFTGMGPILS